MTYLPPHIYENLAIVHRNYLGCKLDDAEWVNRRSAKSRTEFCYCTCLSIHVEFTDNVTRKGSHQRVLPTQ